MKKLFVFLFLPVAFAQPQGVVRKFSLDSPGTAANPSRVIVRFRGAPTFLPGSANSHAIGPDNVHVVNNPPGLSVAEVLERYRQNPNVIYAEPDYFRHTTTVPTDPLWSSQWDMVKIAAPGAWNTQTNSSDIVVAVIDTGVDFTHPDLQANLWVNPTDGSHGFTCINGTCTAGGQDDYGHGTHVAGTIGAVTDNGAGIAGINWRTQILACKFLDASGSGSDSDAVLCFNKVLALKHQGINIRVTSNSWGGDSSSQSLKDAMSAVEAEGVLNVCAAGNSGVNADLAPMYPAAYDNRGIVSVLATDQNDLGASFTNYGLANVDIAAPGVSTVSTVPMGTCPLCDPSGYRPLSGTSMATPHVSAVVVAMFHLNPSLTPSQARDVLLDPGSYDGVTDSIGRMTSTGGRLNFQKVTANPLLASPVANNFPVTSGISNVFANAGSTVSLTASASDPDGDPLRMAWATPGLGSLGLFGYMANAIFPAPSGNSVSFSAPTLARTAVAGYTVSVADGRGGGATSTAYATIQPGANAGGAPSGSLSVSPTLGPAGTTVTASFPVIDPTGRATAWDLWLTGNGGSGLCCQTDSSSSFTLNSAGVYRITTQAVNSQLSFSNRQSTVVRIGGATGTPPIASATFDKLTGTAPLTVNIDLSSSTDPDGTIQTYITNCQWGTSGIAYSGVRTSCTYNTPGTYWIILQVIDNSGLLDVLPAYVVVTPTTSGSSKAAASVTLSNLTQTYTGSALTPTATTNPAGLAVIWANAPQTNAGTYSVTATINDPNYQGAASGTFTIAKAPATVSLSNLTQTYTGSALTPTATTTPAGLGITWTNAPKTTAGTYSVTAAVNNPNYQGSAGSTFTINKASATVALSNLTQTYTGTALAPTATTSPGGLAINWTNAPQTKAGSYPVTATVNDANYQGSSAGTFAINKATASVVLANLTQTYTGSALAPTAATTPAGLAIGWTNAPDTNPGSYAVVATVNDPNYQGSAGGTFTINPALSQTPPTIGLTSPGNGSTAKVKTAVSIQATATAGTNPIARVDFLVNGAVACSDTAATYTCTWTVPSATGRSYQLQAKAYDSTGLSAISSTVTVTSTR